METTQHEDALDLPPPPQLLPDGYQWVRKLCDGGMSELYLARRVGRQSFAKLFVVKLLRAEDDDRPARVARMISEARLTAELNHPNLVQVFDAGQLGRRAYIVMEYLHGVDLRAVLDRLCRRGESAPVGIVCRIVADALAGLEHAHAQPLGRHKEGIIHGDVSPSNVVVTFAGHTKVVDFGIARDYSARAAEPIGDGRPEGKPPYMSPEQALCLPLDRRSDVFSAGIVLWEALAGRRLFARGNDRETIAAVLATPVPPPSTFNASVPPALDGIVLRALARDRALRYPTAKKMRTDVERLLSRGIWPASTADVEAWLAELFSDRLQSERMSIDRIGVVSYEEYLLSTGTGDTGVVAGEIAGESSAIPIVVELPAPAPARASRARRARFVAVAAMALAVLVAGGLAWSRRARAWRATSAVAMTSSARAGAPPDSRAPPPASRPASRAASRAAPSARDDTAPTAATASGAGEPQPGAAATATEAQTAAQATLELYADHRSEFSIDGVLVARAWHAVVAVTAGQPHALAYRRVDHRTLHTLTVPPLAPAAVRRIAVRVGSAEEAP